MTYRPDIDGLRAIAVLSVVLYHAGIGFFPGGFTGVDIFFVISGFLITGIIVNDIRNGGFSFARFYRRRILRIFPALMAVMLCTLAAGYFLLLPGDYADLGESALWALLFSANFYFLFNTGYFDQAAETLPLLHTWSLGVEEQFYILWPLLVLVLYKIAKHEGKAYWTIVLSIISASLLYCLYYSYHSESHAFYLPMARAWELLTGAAIAVLSTRAPASRSPNKLAPMMPWLGLTLLGAGIFYITKDHVYPGFAVILPVAGTALMILGGGTGGNAVSRLLAAPLPVFFGKISYSLYLWHWPIFTYYRHYTGQAELGLMEALILIIISCVVSALSWKLIEQPARGLKISNARTFALGGMATASGVLFSMIVLMSAGFQNRFPEQYRNMTDRDAMAQWNCAERLPISEINASYEETDGKTLCVIGSSWKNSTRKAILWGDSHAGHFLQLLDFAGKQNNISIAHYSLVHYFGCPPYLDNEKIVRKKHPDPKYSENCAAERKEVLSFLEGAANIGLIIIASNWSTHFRRVHEPGKSPDPDSGLELMRLGLAETLARINPARIPVLLVSDVPGDDRDMTSCAAGKKSGLLFKNCDYELRSRDVASLQHHRQSNRVLEEITAGNKGVHLLNVMHRLCDDRSCDNYINNEFIYRDSHHLRVNLAEDTVARMAGRLGLAEAIEAALHRDAVVYSAQ